MGILIGNPGEYRTWCTGCRFQQRNWTNGSGTPGTWAAKSVLWRALDYMLSHLGCSARMVGEPDIFLLLRVGLSG